MFSGIPMDGSAAPLQAGIVEFNPDSMKTITPTGGSSGSGIDPGELFPDEGEKAGKDPGFAQDGIFLDEGVEFVKDPDKGLPQDGGGNSNGGNANEGGNTDGGGTPDPEQPGGEPGDGEDFELVKEKNGKKQNDRRRKIVRLTLLAAAVFIAYRLFFKRR